MRFVENFADKQLPKKLHRARLCQKVSKNMDTYRNTCATQKYSSEVELVYKAPVFVRMVTANVLMLVCWTMARLDR